MKRLACFGARVASVVRIRLAHPVSPTSLAWVEGELRRDAADAAAVFVAMPFPADDLASLGSIAGERSLAEAP